MWNIVDLIKGLSGYTWGIAQGLKLKELALANYNCMVAKYFISTIYAPEIRRNLVSVTVLLNMGYHVIFRDVCMQLVLNKTLIGTGYLLNGFMILNVINQN